LITVPQYCDYAPGIWDADTGDLVITLDSQPDQAAFSAAWSPDGQAVLTGSLDGTARVWDALTGEELRSLGGHTGGVSSAKFSPDTPEGTGGRTIVTAGEDGTARVWDAQTGQQVLSLEHPDWVRSADYSPDGQTIVTAGEDGVVRVWDAQTGEQLRALEGHTARVWSAAYSPDGLTIVTASDDHTARVWDAQTGQQLRSLEGHSDGVWSAAYSPDGRTIVTSSADFSARVWIAQVEDLLDMAESLIQREPPILTPEERQRFLGE
jgi:WD40 repeat protein